jgi:hypothetical protein
MAGAVGRVRFQMVIIPWHANFVSHCRAPKCVRGHGLLPEARRKMCAVSTFRCKNVRARRPFVGTPRFPPCFGYCGPVFIRGMAGAIGRVRSQRALIPWHPDFGSDSRAHSCSACGYLRVEHLIASVVVGDPRRPGGKCVPLRLFAVKMSAPAGLLWGRRPSLRG